MWNEVSVGWMVGCLFETRFRAQNWKINSRDFLGNLFLSHRYEPRGSKVRESCRNQEDWREKWEFKISRASLVLVDFSNRIQIWWRFWDSFNGWRWAQDFGFFEWNTTKGGGRGASEEDLPPGQAFITSAQDTLPIFCGWTEGRTISLWVLI